MNTPYDQAQRYDVRFLPASRWAISRRLPEPVATVVLEFRDQALAVNLHRVGKPIFGPLAGCHCARRGTYRIDDETRTVPSSTLTSESPSLPQRRLGCS